VAIRPRTLKSWGEVKDMDHVWVAHAFDVSDPLRFLAALDRLMTSPTGRKFPGQMYLSAVVAAGVSPVSHVISVGYDSEAEMDAWFAVRDPSSDWAAYIAASESVSEYLGASMARDLKSWGPATLAELTGRSVDPQALHLLVEARPRATPERRCPAEAGHLPGRAGRRG
jgi:hypothetical protein